MRDKRRRNEKGNIHSAQTDDLLLLRLRVEFDDGDGRQETQRALHDVHTYDDRVLFVEDRDRLQLAGEHGVHLRVLLLLLLELAHVLLELIEQMVDNVRLEHLDVVAVGEFLRLLIDLDIESKYHSVLW